MNPSFSLFLVYYSSQTKKVYNITNFSKCQIIKISFVQNMNFLTNSSCKNLDRYFRFIGQVASYRQASYLSFYSNLKGDKLRYDSTLSAPTTYLNESSPNLQEYSSSINPHFVNSQSFLTGVFHNHIISSSQVNGLLKNCVDLDLMLKKDIVNFMFSNKFSYDIKGWVQNFRKGSGDKFDLKWQVKEKMPNEKRKNFFIVKQQKVTNFNQLQDQISKLNNFLIIPNLNKILCLDLQVLNSSKFNSQLSKVQSFFKQHNIKLKLLASDKVPEQFTHKPHLKLGYGVHKLIEYITKNIKGNMLLHQLPEYYQFYSEALNNQKVSVANLHHIEPKQVFLFIQRTQSLEMAQSPLQNKDFSFEQLNKNFVRRFQKQDPYYQQTASGFIISRFLSKYQRKKFQLLIKTQQSGQIKHFSEDK